MSGFSLAVREKMRAGWNDPEKKRARLQKRARTLGYTYVELTNAERREYARLRRKGLSRDEVLQVLKPEGCHADERS